MRANYLDSDPSWAPDGSRVLFSRCAPLKGAVCEGRQTIWSVSSDGSHQHMLSPDCRRRGTSRAAFARCPDDGQGVYSPSGHRIAFVRYVGVPEIAIADGHLRHVRLLRPFGSGSGAPDIDALAWSPDGRRLAFSVHNDNGKLHKPVGGRAVYVVNVNGSGLRRVTPWKLEAGGLGELDWSPDGSHLLFRSITFTPRDGPGPSSGDIYTIRPDGTGLRRLTNLAAGTGIQLGSYSPDGSHIVFTTNDGGTQGPGSSWPDVFVMHADGNAHHPGHSNQELGRHAAVGALREPAVEIGPASSTCRGRRCGHGGGRARSEGGGRGRDIAGFAGAIALTGESPGGTPQVYLLHLASGKLSPADSRPGRSRGHSTGRRDGSRLLVRRERLGGPRALFGGRRRLFGGPAHECGAGERMGSAMVSGQQARRLPCNPPTTRLALRGEGRRHAPTPTHPPVVREGGLFSGGFSSSTFGGQADLVGARRRASSPSRHRAGRLRRIKYDQGFSRLRNQTSRPGPPTARE